jgi:segregation and condensation protein B
MTVARGKPPEIPPGVQSPTANQPTDFVEAPGKTSLERLPEASMIELLSAALLACGRPVKPRELGQLLGLPDESIERLVRLSNARLADAGLGFEIEAVAGGFRLIIRPALVPLLAPLLAPAPLPKLSERALEVLAIIAYKQPMTRGEIEVLRGSNPSSALESLLERELIVVVGRKETLGRPMLYGTSEKFLLEFGLRSLGDLPLLDNDDLPNDFLRG